MATPLRVLIVEKRQQDYDLILRRLRRAGFKSDARLVNSESDFLAALDSPPDIIISDYNLQKFDGLRALKLVQERGLDIPFILFSGAIGEEAVVDALKQGVYDYVMKKRPARLEQVVTRALAEKKAGDIKRRVDQQLNASPNQLADILNHAAEAIIALNSQYQIIVFNHAAEKMFGYDAAEVLGKPLDPVLPRAFVEIHRRHVSEFAKSPHSTRPLEERRLSLTARRKDGSEFPVEIGLSKLEENGDRIFVAMVVDITERLHAESALRESEERYRLIANNVTDMVWIADLNLNLIYVSPSSERHRGFTADEMKKLPLDQQMTPASLELAMRSLGEALAREDMPHSDRNRIITLELEFYRKDGSTYWSELKLKFLRDGNGKPTAILASGRDITERKSAEQTLKESEARYRTLFENMLEGFAHCKMIFENGKPVDFTYLTVNSAFEKLTGLKDVVGKNVTEVIPGIRQSNPELFEIYGRVALTGTPERLETFVEPLGIWFSLSVYSYEKGFFVAVFDTITDRKRAEQEILRRNQQLLSLHQVSQELVHLADPSEILESIFNGIARVLDNRNLYIALYDEEKQYLTFPVYTINGERRDAAIGRPFGSGMTEYVIRHRAPLFVPSGLDEKMKELGIALVGAPAKTFMAVPMQVGHKIIGVIALQDYDHANAYDQTELELLSTFATQAANALENARLFEETSKRAEQFSSLYETVRELATFSDLSGLLQIIIDRATAMLGSPSGIIYLLDPTREELELVAVKASELELGTRYSINESGGMVAQAARTRKAVIVNDYQNWENRRPGTVELGIRAAIQVPMLYGGALIGILGVGEFGDSTRKFTEEDARLLTLFAGHAAAAVHNARLLEETKQRADEFAALYDTALELSAQTKPERLLETVAQRAKTLLNTAAGAVYLYDPSREELELSISVGAPLPIGTRLKLGEGAAGRAAQLRQPLAVDDYQTWEHRSPQYKDMPFSAVLHVPMLYGGILVGVLAVHEVGKSTRKFTDADIRLLMLLASQAASAVNNAELLEGTKQRAGEFAALYETASELSTRTDLSPLLDTIARRAMTLLNAPGGAMYLHDQSRGDLELVAAVGVPAEVGTRLEMGEGMAGLVGQSRKPLIVDDYKKWEHRSRKYTGVPYAAVVQVPMLYGGNLIGILSAFEIGDSRRKFNEQDARLLTLFASQAASAVHNASLLEETRARAEQLATLNEIGRTISSNIDINSVIEALQRQSARIIPFDTFYVTLHDSATGRLTYPLYYEAGKRYSESSTVMKRGTYLSRTIETALPLLINRTQQELGSAAKPFNALGDTSRKSASLMFAPMVYGSHAIGVVSAQSYSLNAYSEEHLGMLGAIANQAAIAIQNARLFEQTKQRADEFAALYDISRDIAMLPDTSALMQTIVDRASVLLGASGSSIAIYDPQRGDLLVAVAKDFPAQVGMRLKIGEGIAGRVAASRQPIIVQDYRHWEHRLLQYEETQPISTVMAVPILYSGDLFGVVTTYQSDPAVKGFTEADAHLLSLLASQAAGPLHNARLLEETKRRAEQLSTLNEIGKAVSSQLDVDQTLEEIYRQVKRILPVDAFYVALYNHDRNEVSYPLFYDEGMRYNERSGEPLQGTRLDETIRTGKSILINHTAESFAAEHQTTMLGNTSRVSASLMLAPLRSGALVVGAISAQSYTFNAYTEEHLNIFNGIANQAAIAIENARLFADTQRHLQQVQSLHEIDSAISGSLDLRVTFNIFLDKIITQLGVDATDVLLLNHHTQTLEFAASRGFRTPALQHTHLRVGDGLAGRAALDRKIVAVPDLAKDIDSLARSPLIQNEKFLSYYGVPLIAKGRVNGVLEIFQRKYGDRNKEWMDFLETLAGQAAIAIDNAELYGNLQRANIDLSLAYDTTLEGWSRALDLRDRETEGHTQRVTELTLRLAREMEIQEAELVHIRRGGLLHDIGKMGIPDSILFKPGPLTDEEWKIMRQHPVIAHELIAPIEFLRHALDIPYCHHEKWDGSGYPRGLIGEHIPLAARLFAIADVWDALSSDRPYRKAWDQDRVREYIHEQSGSHFDPAVVQVFLKTIK